MIFLLHAAVMPAATYGTYQFLPATLNDLFAVVRGERGEWCSCIGYDATADRVEQWTGVRPEVSRREAVFSPGDQAIILHPRARQVAPGAAPSLPEDPAQWEIGRMIYLG